MTNILEIKNLCAEKAELHLITGCTTRPNIPGAVHPGVGEHYSRPERQTCRARRKIEEEKIGVIYK